MKILFSIRYRKRNYKFETASDLEEFIFKYQKQLKNSFIILYNNTVPSGKISVSSYLSYVKKSKQKA